MQPLEMATTVGVQDGETPTIDGPFVEISRTTTCENLAAFGPARRRCL